MRQVSWRHLLFLVVGQFAGYVTLVALAVLTLIGLALGASADTTTAGGPEVADLSEQLDISGVAAFLTLPFQLAGLWLFGTFDVAVAAQGDSADVLSLWTPNLLALALAGIAALAVGRAAGGTRRARARAAGSASHSVTKLSTLPRAAKLVLAGGSALVMALLTLLLTLALAFRQTVDVPFLGQIHVVGSAVSASLFFGAFIFYLVIAALLCASHNFTTRMRHHLHRVLPSLWPALRVIVVHAVVLIVPVLVYALIRLAADGSLTAVLSFLWWGSTAAGAAFVLLTSGALRAHGSLADFPGVGSDDTLYLWTAGLSWWEVLLAALLAALGLAVAALIWGLRRDSRPEVLREARSWFTLPLIYALTGVLVTFFAQIKLGVTSWGMGLSTAAFGPAWWTFAQLLLIGLLIELAARFLIPLLAPRLPQALVRFIRSQPHRRSGD